MCDRSAVVHDYSVLCTSYNTAFVYSRYIHDIFTIYVHVTMMGICMEYTWYIVYMHMYYYVILFVKFKILA